MTFDGNPDGREDLGEAEGDAEEELVAKDAVVGVEVALGAREEEGKGFDDKGGELYDGKAENWPEEGIVDKLCGVDETELLLDGLVEGNSNGPELGILVET